MPCRRACRPPWKVASRDSQQPAVEDDCASIQFCPTSRGILSGESPAHAREPGRSSPPKREETQQDAVTRGVNVACPKSDEVTPVEDHPAENEAREGDLRPDAQRARPIRRRNSFLNSRRDP